MQFTDPLIYTIFSLCEVPKKKARTSKELNLCIGYWLRYCRFFYLHNNTYAAALQYGAPLLRSEALKA